MFNKLWNKLVNRETISYTIFGVLTTVVDWVVYTVLRLQGVDYLVTTVLSWCAAVAFAYITNKLWVFRNYNFYPGYVMRELVSFVACRVLTGIFTVVGMIIMVDWMGIGDFISKLFISVLVILLNYVFSKMFIFKKQV